MLHLSLLDDEHKGPEDAGDKHESLEASGDKLKDLEEAGAKLKDLLGDELPATLFSSALARQCCSRVEK